MFKANSYTLRLAALFLLAALLPSLAAESVAPATTIATESKFARAEPWKKACAERAAAFKGKPCDLIFIGDSITRRFDDLLWKAHFEPRRALNFGVAADHIQHALWRMENQDIKDLRPKVVVVMLGINNSKDTPEDIAAGVKAVIEKARTMFPGVKVVVMSITANKRMPEKTPLINDLLRKLTDDREVFYCDLYATMTPTDGSFKGLNKDGVHLSYEGYKLWIAALEPLLKRLLGET